MRIAHVLAGEGILGGLEKHVVDLSEAQAARGHHVRVLTTASLAGFFSDTVETLPVRLDRPRWDPRLRRELRGVLRELRPDLVHAHANKAAAAVGPVARRGGLPSVATVQNVKKNQSMFAHFDRVIAASGVVAKSLDGISSTVIRNSVASPDPSHRGLAEDLNPPFREKSGRLLYAAGRFVPAKGYDLLLEALANLPEAFLWLAGDGPEKERLVALIRQKNLAHRVWLPGFLPPEKILGLMSLADIFVISSRREGGPYTLSEALRHRCPVVSTKVGFAPELLEAEHLCEEVSAASLTIQLDRAMADLAGFRLRMESVFTKADHELDIERMVDAVMAVYATLPGTAR